MKIKEINKLIPELRFPEFKDSGEWEIKPLSDLLDYEQPDKYIVKNTNYSNEGIPVLTANKSFILGYSKENFGVYDNLPAIIFDDFTVDNKYVDFPFKVKSSAIKILTAKKDDNLRFVYELMSQIKFDAIQHKRYYISQYQTLNVPVPNIPEQQKIAAFLSNLDELIEAHKQKLELLKRHKKGLMQNLFPQEGEKVPKWRFPEFKDSGEWVEKKLGKICKLVRGPFGGALKKEIFVKDGFAVYEQSHAIYGKFDSFRYFINDEKFSKLKRFSVNSGDLIMSCSGTMGKFAVIPKQFKKGVINQALLKLTVEDDYDNLFIKLILETEFYQNKLLSQSAGGAIKNVVSVSQIKELNLYIPTKQEQQKIASCLLSIDEIITAEAEKIEQLEKHKKGLMQGLFPEIN